MGRLALPRRCKDPDTAQNFTAVEMWANARIGTDGTITGLPPAIPGPPGVAGKTYFLNLLGGAQGVVYDGTGANPFPSTMPAFSFELFENGLLVTTGMTQVWSVAAENTHLTGSSTAATFSPTIASTFAAGASNNYVRVTVTYAGQTIVQSIPVAVVKTGTGAAALELSYCDTEGGTYHSTFAPVTDLYMKQRIGSGAWSAAMRIVGLTGAGGTDGANGTDGSNGINGADGSSLYTWLKYADTPTTGMSDSPTGKVYMGIAYDKASATESSDYADYGWSLIQGPAGVDGSDGSTGEQGIQGPAGADGMPRYSWVKYGTSAAGAGLNDSPTGMSYIGIAYNKTTATESTTASDYEWSLILGPQGATGNTGSTGPQGPAGGMLQKVFFATPTTPYQIADMWWDGGIMHRCTTAQSTGTYNAAHWALYSITADYVAANIGISSPNIVGGTYKTSADGARCEVSDDNANAWFKLFSGSGNESTPADIRSTWVAPSAGVPEEFGVEIAAPHFGNGSTDASVSVSTGQHPYTEDPAFTDSSARIEAEANGGAVSASVRAVAEWDGTNASGGSTVVISADLTVIEGGTGVLLDGTLWGDGVTVGQINGLVIQDEGGFGEVRVSINTAGRLLILRWFEGGIQHQSTVPISVPTHI